MTSPKHAILVYCHCDKIHVIASKRETFILTHRLEHAVVCCLALLVGTTEVLFMAEETCSQDSKGKVRGKNGASKIPLDIVSPVTHPPLSYVS